MEFRATLDGKSKITTGVVGALFLAIALYNFKVMNALAIDQMEAALLAGTTPLIVGIVAFCYLYRPLGYTVKSGKVTFRRPLKDQ